jgi:hypothetical protein
MAAVLLPEGKQSFQTNGSLPLVGGKVYTYEPGTSTPKDTYTTSAMSVANANPVILDSRGEATIFWSGAYDVILKTSADVTIWGPIRHETPEISGSAAAVLTDLASTSDAAKGDALVGVKSTLTGGVARTQHDKNSERYSPEDFGALGNGSSDDAAAFNAGLAVVDTLYGTPGKTYLLASTVTVTSNKTLIGNGAALKGSSGVTSIRMTGNDNSIRSWNVNANDGLYFIRDDGARNSVESNRFYGGVGHYVFATSTAKSLSVIGNSVNGSEQDRITTSFVFEDVVGITASHNRFVNIENWCIQVRGASRNAKIIGNDCYATEYTSTVVATAGQTVFNFTLSKACHLAGIQVNGAPFDTGLTFSPTIPAASPTTSFTVTFSVGRTVGDSVKLIAHRAAENIQINGSTTDFTIVGNTCDGGGDSGILMAGTCSRGTITANNVRNIAYSGISTEGGTSRLSIFGNTIVDCSRVTTAATYGGAILLGATDSYVGGNMLVNSSSPATMKYGVSVNVYAGEDGSFNEPVKIGANNYVGAFTKKVLIPNEDAVQKRAGVRIIDGVSVSYPERINIESAFTNKPANTAFWTYTFFGATGSIRDTTIKQGGSASIKTVAGEYIDATPTAVGIFKDCIVDISFWAKNDSGSSYVTAFLDVGGSYIGSPSVTVSSTSWTQYNLSFPFTSQLVAASFFIRIGGTTGFANVQHIEVNCTKIE